MTEFQVGQLVEVSEQTSMDANRLAVVMLIGPFAPFDLTLEFLTPAGAPHQLFSQSDVRQLLWHGVPIKVTGTAI